MREEGYYWVTSEYWEKPRIAEWSDGAWWIGDEPSLADLSGIEVLGERLEPPQPVTGKGLAND